MRVFIAIEIDEEVKDELVGVQKKIGMFVTRGNYTDRTNFHVTLRFIGDADEKEISRLKQVVDEAALRVEPFELSLNGLGQFPRRNKAIIWAGLEGELGRLKDLKRVVEEELEQKGFTKEDRDYNPHITLLRQASLEKPLEEIGSEEVSVSEAGIKVKSLSLMESKRVDGKLVYEPVYKKTISELKE